MAHILIVDDSPTERHFLKSVLVENGYDISLAENGEQGIEIAKATHPDLILMDVVMPGMNGFSTSEAIQKQQNWQHIPIIMCTATQGAQNVAAARHVINTK